MNPPRRRPTDRAFKRTPPPPLKAVPDAPPVAFIKGRVQAKPDRSEPHDIGWLPGEGWFCTTCGHGRCPHIQTLKETVR